MNKGITSFFFFFLLAATNDPTCRFSYLCCVQVMGCRFSSSTFFFFKLEGPRLMDMRHICLSFFSSLHLPHAFLSFILFFFPFLFLCFQPHVQAPYCKTLCTSTNLSFQQALVLHFSLLLLTISFLAYTIFLFFSYKI